MNNYEIEERIKRYKKKKAQYEDIRDSVYSPIVVLGTLAIIGLIFLSWFLVRNAPYKLFLEFIIIPVILTITIIFIVRVSLHYKRKADVPFEIDFCEREIEALQLELQKTMRVKPLKLTTLK